MTIDDIKGYLRDYDGDDINIMEVCGSHTGAIAKSGIPGMLSDKIHLISGPGCPVCVTPSAYIDKLIYLAKNYGDVIVTFGDLIRVPGSISSLSEEKGAGIDVRMVYSPMDVISMAKDEPESRFIFAAVGFETTAPVYARLVDEIIAEGITNVRLLCAIKIMPPVIDALMRDGANIDAFLAPGHVSVVTGSDVFLPLAKRYEIPFAVAGFSGERILIAIYDLLIHQGRGVVRNDYPSVVTSSGNEAAKNMVDKYFRPADAAWRGIGIIEASGLMLREEYEYLDAGSFGLDSDEKKNAACICGEVLVGKKRPKDCPLFGRACTPLNPQGACMVSTEGSCFNYYGK